MNKEILSAARREFHAALEERLWSVREGVPSNADKYNATSKAIGLALAEAVGVSADRERLRGSEAGSEFERRTMGFLGATFPHLGHLRPGLWQVVPGTAISEFEQYAHLEALQQSAAANRELAAALGSDYTIKPDIIITRKPEPDERINEHEAFVVPGLARFTPLRAQELRATDPPTPSVSCKWTIRSDRTQNSRAEALNLLPQSQGSSAPHRCGDRRTAAQPTRFNRDRHRRH